jgi:hypothetical protein
LGKKTHILTKDTHELIEYFKNLDDFKNEEYYVSLIDFGKMHEIHDEYAVRLRNFYKKNPIKYIAALKDGYMIEVPIDYSQGVWNFLNGNDVVIKHKKTGKTHTVNDQTVLPDGFNLNTVKEWNWFINASDVKTFK